MYSVYEVTDIGDDLSGVEGQHVELTLRERGDTRTEVGESHVIHERLINRWFRDETSTFHPLPDGMEMLE
jgi:hypothetical protein